MSQATHTVSMAPRTERGKRLAYHDGYEYRFAEHSADGERSFWRCTRRGCSARAVGPNESTTVAPRAGGKPHSHPPEPSKQEVRSRIAIAKGSGGNDSGRSTRSIVQEVNRGLEEEQLNLMPARSTMMRNINNSCSIKGFSEANSRDAIKIVLPEELVSFQDDFEAGAQNAARTVWPAVKIRSCLFHLSQSVWRKVQALGLQQLYADETEVRRAIRSLSALAFLKPDEVSLGFDEIKRSAPMDIPPLNDLFEYFNDTYIGSNEIARFTVEDWNVHDTRYRINPSEGIAVRARIKKYLRVDKIIQETVELFDATDAGSRSYVQHLGVFQNALCKY
ncbi:hypothetical protein QR680_017365 [Steinernema hermaphroditum]|uniref:FLYWCH-type domain-containing protein n=1 Tax=Steinernema hermaphroditum TaxID=289476 RepID=A0AA39LNI4_9BILA|nr:hypothetical protein QR680_017365 [Steinernema hermaphroditum]